MRGWLVGVRTGVLSHAYFYAALCLLSPGDSTQARLSKFHCTQSNLTPFRLFIRVMQIIKLFAVMSRY